MTSPASDDDLQLAACPVGMEPFNDHPSTCGRLTGLRNKAQLNQVSYAFSMAEQMLPCRDLLKPAVPFHWDNTLNQLFEESKIVITAEIANGVKD